MNTRTCTCTQSYTSCTTFYVKYASYTCTSTKCTSCKIYWKNNSINSSSRYTYTSYLECGIGRARLKAIGKRKQPECTIKLGVADHASLLSDFIFRTLVSAIHQHENLSPTSSNMRPVKALNVFASEDALDVRNWQFMLLNRTIKHLRIENMHYLTVHEKMSNC